MGNRSDSKVESLVLGFILILLGSLFLLHNFTPLNIFPHLWKLWPLVLIVLGGSHLFRWLNRTGRLPYHGLAAVPAESRPRKRRGKEIVLVTAVILVGLLIGQQGRGRTTPIFTFTIPDEGHSVDKRLEQPLDLDRGDLLVLTNEFGPVTVRPAEGGEPQVECRLTLTAGSQESAEEKLESAMLTVIRGDGTLDVSCQAPEDSSDGFQLVAEMELRVPREITLHLDSRNGSVLVDGLRGEVRIQAADDKVTLREIGGPVSVSTGRGDIRLKQIDGPVTAASRGGSIDVKKCGGDLEVKSDGGTTTCHTVNGRTSIELQDGKLVLIEARGPVELFLEEAKARIEEIAGPLHLVGRECGISLTNCYSTVSLEGDSLNVETQNIRRDLTLDCTDSAINLVNTLGDLQARMEHGSLICSGKLYRSRIDGSFTPITVGNCEGLLEIRSRQGDVTLRHPDPGAGNQVSVSTSGGNILLELNPDQCDYNLIMTAVSGMITSLVSGLEITTLEPPVGDGEETVRGVARCGSGEQLIELQTEYADIRLEAAR
jgi:hypothetical protein